MKNRIPRVLTVAGSDSGGGAGIEADIKTITVLGGYAAAAVTSVTAQNTLGVTGIYDMAPGAVTAQMEAVLGDIGADAVKTGMLSSAEIVGAVAGVLERFGPPPLVVDPVMVAKSGDALLAAEARDALISRLLPLALVVTPNLHEAGVLVGREITDLASMNEAAREIAQMGPRVVVVKGGHLEDRPADLVFVAETDQVKVLESARYDTPNTHGTGCTFSAAIAAGLALGMAPLDAIRQAKKFISIAIEASLDIGHGHGPTNHGEAGRRLAAGTQGGEGTGKASTD